MPPPFHRLPRRSLFAGDLAPRFTALARRPLVTKLLQLAGAMLLATTITGRAESALAGSWHIDLARSTELSPWKDYDLTITADGDRTTIHRRLAWGRREFSDEMTVTTGTTVAVPVLLWPDNRHLGAYIADDHRKHVRAEWLDGGRILRLSTDLVLSTQQGDRAVNILSNYKVSANGAVLTLTELRSTRNRPVVYVFIRTTPASP
jgi:hypothetical protein